MAPTYHLEIINVVENAHNGHITVHSRVVEQEGEDTKLGAVESHGIEAIALERLYNGDVEQWLQAIGTKMHASHIQRAAHKSSLERLKVKGHRMAIAMRTIDK